MCGVQRAASRIILSFYQVGPWNQTQVIRLQSRCLYQLSHLIGPVTNFFSEGPDRTYFRIYWL